MAVARPGPSVSPTANVADQQFEQLTAKGTEGVQRLRRNVQRIFDHLATGVTERVNAGMSNEKVYAKELKELLNEVLDEYEKIDKICQSLPNRNYPALLASRSFLAVNQSLLENRENYNQIICETEWLRKATEFSWFESNMLMTQGQAFRRFSRLSYRQRPGNGAVNAFSQPIFEQVFQSLQGFFKQQHAANPTQHPVDLRKLQSNGVSNCVLLIVKPVMQVVLVMRGVIIEFVNIKALHETFDTDDGNNICIKQMSAYPMFRELTGYMKSYFLGFTANITSNAQQINLNTLINSGRSQIMSLVQYRHLFNEPCGVCKRILRDRMPPIIREYRTTMPPNQPQPAPMHRACRGI